MKMKYGKVTDGNNGNIRNREKATQYSVPDLDPNQNTVKSPSIDRRQNYFMLTVTKSLGCVMAITYGTFAQGRYIHSGCIVLYVTQRSLCIVHKSRLSPVMKGPYYSNFGRLPRKNVVV